MEILTEFDELQEAMKKINLNESVMPYVNGILVNDRAYNQVQKILNCPEMISAHKFLYNLDLDQLSEDEEIKIDKLYKLGVDRGFIDDDLTDWDADSNDVSATIDATANDVSKSVADSTEQKPISGSLFKAKIPCWTIIYSAVSKDGAIKTGEAYSNAISAAAAKADVKSKLSNVGYSNIAILAIESCEADDVGDNVVSSKEVEENDMLRNRPHNAHVDDPAGVVNEEDDEKEDDSEEKSDDEEKSDEDTESEDDSEEDSDEDKSDDDKSEEESDEEKSDEDSGDEEESDDEESDEDSDEDSGDEEDKKELSAKEKNQLKNEYKQTFKNALVKCGFDGSFNDLTLEEKVKFFTELSKTWKKNEPSEFMTDKEIEQLNNVIVNADEDSEDEEESDDNEQEDSDEGDSSDEEKSDEDSEDEEESDDEESDEDSDEDSEDEDKD